MEDAHIIYTDRLNEDKCEKIHCVLSPDFIDVTEEELSFNEPVKVAGEVYIASGHLILHLTIETVAKKPCTICNTLISQKISITNLYHSVELADIKDALYDIRPAVREGILLEVPHFIECNNGNCPQRAQCQKYYKSAEEVDETHYPFADIEKKFNIKS